MQTKKVLLITTATVFTAGVLGVAGFVGFNGVKALIAHNNNSPLVQNLAKTFNVSTDQVQKVFEDTKDQQFTSRLDALVTAGKITAEQKTMIINKKAEVEAKVTEINNKQMTTTERREAMKALRDEIKAWADTNKIDLQYCGFGLAGGKGMMRGIN